MGGARKGLKASEAREGQGAGEGEGEQEGRREGAGRPGAWFALQVDAAMKPSQQAGLGSRLQVGRARPSVPRVLAGLEHSPAPGHHQLHFHFVGNDDAQDLSVGSFPQPARRQGSRFMETTGRAKTGQGGGGEATCPSPGPLSRQERAEQRVRTASAACGGGSGEGMTLRQGIPYL